MRVPLVDLAAQEAVVIEEVLGAIAANARAAKFVLGDRVQEFEGWLAATCGAVHAVGVASGTDALELTLRALGIGAGDAVVTPAFSFVAAAEAIAMTGARPVFCDIDDHTLNASAHTISAAIARAATARLRVKAIVPVHLFGLCAPVSAFVPIAKGEGLAIIEDAAQSLGARDAQGHAAGSIGDAGCFSFFPTKNLGGWGDGGAVVTSRAEMAGRLRKLRSHGASAPYVHEELGRNSRLDALQAAVLLAKRHHLPAWQAARARVAARYLDELAPFPVVLPQAPLPPAVHAWNAFVLRTPRRDELGAWLRDAGVETRVYYPLPLHKQPCFAALEEPPLRVAEEACRTALALPMHAAMSGEQQAHVIASVARFFG